MSKSDLIDAVENSLAALAIALQVLLVLAGLLALASLFSAAARARLAAAATWLGPSLWPAATIALAATAGSLFFSEYADFIPCPLCWYQRIAMYPLVVILAIAAYRRDTEGAFRYALPLTVIGAVIAAYHVYVEYAEIETAFCQVDGPSCATKWIEVYGYVTIPVLSLTAFLAIAVLLAGVRFAGRAGR